MKNNFILVQTSESMWTLSLSFNLLKLATVELQTCSWELWCDWDAEMQLSCFSIGLIPIKTVFVFFSSVFVHLYLFKYSFFMMIQDAVGLHFSVLLPWFKLKMYFYSVYLYFAFFYTCKQVFFMYSYFMMIRDAVGMHFNAPQPWFQLRLGSARMLNVECFAALSEGALHQSTHRCLLP